MKNVLIVAAHPDDEIIGVGATAARHVEEGDCVKCVILGQGEASRWKNQQVPKELLAHLHTNTMEAAKIIGFNDVIFADFPDNRFDSIDLLDIIKFVDSIITKFKPDIVYTHHAGDLNIDHQITYKAVLTASRPLPGNSISKIFTFSTLSSTEWTFSPVQQFCPTVFVNIEKQYHKKKSAIEKYDTELRPYPHPRSLKGIQLQSQLWGCMVGIQYAEAFMLIREIR